MDFPQVLIPVIVVTPLLVFIVFAMKRRPAAKVSIPVLEPSLRHTLTRGEMTASRSTTVTRELTLSAKYEKELARIIAEGGAKGPFCQLPPLPQFIIGRRSELSRALALLDAPQPPRALAITSARGLAGVGRTGFAATLAHLLAKRFPDAQLFIAFPNEETAAPQGVIEAMRHAIRALNPTAVFPLDLAGLPALYRESLAGKRVLFLIENIQPQPHLELLQPPEPGSLLLLTSREPVAFARMETLALEPFSRLDARAFLRAFGTRTSREPDKHLDLFAELSGYLPEALRLNATRFHANPAQTIDEHFDQLKKADAFKHPLEAARALAGEKAMAASAPARPVSAPRSVAEVEPGRATWESMRAFIQRFQSRSEADFSLTDIPGPFADPSHGPAPAYADALRFIANAGDPGAAIGQLEAAVSAARALKDRPAETRALANLGKARAEAGEPRLAVACFERWVENARESGDRQAEAESLGWLGAGWTRAGFADRGTGCFEAQLRIAREVGDRMSELSALGKLGEAKSILGDFQNAAALHTERLEIARSTGEKTVELDALEQLGAAHSRMKDHEKAGQFHEDQLVAARATGDLASESRALGCLGQIAIHRGRIEEAIAQYEAQLAVAGKLGDSTAQSHAHASLGAAWARQGDLGEAVAHYEQQLQIAQKMGNRLGEATAHSNIGSGRERLGDLPGAAAAWEKALAIYESLGSPSADSMRRWLERVRTTLAGGAQS